MPATPMTASTRYSPIGITKVYFCSAIANKLAPTRGELNAGTDLTGEVSDIGGWQPTSASVDTPDLLNRFVGSVPGRITADESSLTFYRSSNSVDVRGLLPRDTVGFVVFLDEGDVAARKMDVFPITVASAPKDRSMEEAGRIVVNFKISSTPAENVAIP
jgi:hypothetical protein